MANNKKKSIKETKSFWETLPGILTAIAAIITAIGGCAGVVLANPRLLDSLLPASPTPPTAMPIIESPPTFQTFDTNDVRVSSKDGMKMVFVPSGNFQMGSNNGYPDEKPVHTVYLDSFWIDQTEITNKMYGQCVSISEACLPPSPTEFTGNYFRNPKFANYPVVYVSSAQAIAYCSWVGRYLPSEAQWEKAARSTDDRTFPWGNDEPNSSLLNFNNIVGGPAEVGSYPLGASPYGALDMAGNVAEWVSDFYNDSIYGYWPIINNPSGPEMGEYRVLRGGSWSDNSDTIRSTMRQKEIPNITNTNIGFRCASPVSP